MRREDHRMPQAECEALLHRAEVLRLGLSDAEGPYVVPVNFGFADGRIYVHGAREGRRIAAVAEGARVCFEADEGEIVRADRPCGFTSRFSSVIGYGTARLLTSAEDKRRGLDTIMRHYGSTGDGIPDAKLETTSVMELVIEGMDGKWHPPVREG
ncbi:MAG: pyridoxamine 5'-phosphate oxidase family protein [Coriobacteriia bacterium]|nr:pyridoxamine 5'-phosphate oxidase family protein [Coriobacteriia bacterium]